jgi:hypothetical protein
LENNNQSGVGQFSTNGIPLFFVLNFQFSLLSGFYEIATKKQQYNILIVGLDSSGKTVQKNNIKTI